MAGESEVVQVELTTDGSRPVDLPQQFATVGDMATSFKEAQATITRLSQPQEEKPAEKPKEPVKKTDSKDGLTNEMRSAMETMANFNEAQRKIRFEKQVGAEGLMALETFMSGEEISKELKSSYEAALDSGNEAMIDANFNLIRTTFENKNGAFETPENMVAGIAGGGIPVPVGTTPFRSLEEQLTAQRDPKYKSDPAFRVDVENRIGITPPYPQV